MSDDPQRRRRGHAPGSVRTAAVRESVLALADEARSRLGHPARVVDLGGGSGVLAVPLGQAGHEVTVVDPSPDALASLGRRAREVGVSERITGLQGDSSVLADLVPAGGADLVCCHGVLEYVDDPAATVAAVAPVLAPGGVLSLVVAQRLGTVLARALAGRFAQAREVLEDPDGRWGADDPLPRRFDPDRMRELVTGAGLEVVHVQGVRLFADLVPAAFLDTEADRAALLDLEAAVAADPAAAVLGHVAAATHVVARKA
ncbi:methyltransferase domain-containing protein [Agilicoccus flavus]|uniref:methyltransferase domain-containing protein n=1 Tax=Agilicoccus flavus TaxID=2775968 RepID=UPI001CF7173C|nr:methyltransferase domain-containing protein [Agilicoccus flavus]